MKHCQWLLFLIEGNYSWGSLKTMHRLKIGILILYKHCGICNNLINMQPNFFYILFYLIGLHPIFWSFYFCWIWFYKSHPLSRFNLMLLTYNMGVAYLGVVCMTSRVAPSVIRKVLSMVGFLGLESARVLRRPPITNLKSWTHWGLIVGEKNILYSQRSAPIYVGLSSLYLVNLVDHA